jgi:hypothetical protein
LLRENIITSTIIPAAFESARPAWKNSAVFSKISFLLYGQRILRPKSTGSLAALEYMRLGD